MTSNYDSKDELFCETDIGSSHAYIDHPKAQLKALSVSRQVSAGS